MSSTHSVAALTSASTGLVNSRSRRCLGSEPELTPTRSGVPWRLATSTTSAVFSGPPMLPGLIRTQCAPASMALIASVWLKWMSAITGIGESRTIVLSASTSCSRGTATRTMSAPASATRRIWSIVGPRFAVSVLVIVWTATGAPPPMGTPPTWICRAEAMPGVYEARGPRWRLRRSSARRSRSAEPYPPGACPTSTAPRAGACARAWPLRLAARARARRHERFFALTGLEPGMRIVDVGCGALGLRGLEPGLDITGVDVARARDYPGPFVQADATERLPFDDGAFDLAYSSSVVEHVDPARRAAFAAEIRRVARGWFVQTPAWSFPIEPHALLPFAHWLPARCGAATGGWAPPARGRTSRCCAEPRWSPCSASRSTPSAWEAWPRAGSRCGR